MKTTARGFFLLLFSLNVLPGIGQTCIYLAEDIYPGSFGSAPTLLTEYGSAFYFSCTGNGNGTEFWKYENGSATMVADIYPGFLSSSPNDFTVVGSDLYFTANNGVNGKELWRYDGTTAAMVADVYPGSNTSMPENLTAVGTDLYFTANNGLTGKELWKFDGTTASLIADLNPGIAPSGPAEITAVGGNVYFTANNGVNGLELYKYDGVTTTLIDINPGATGSDPYELTPFLGNVCFRANDGVSGTELWKYNGSTAILVDINPTGNSNPYELTVLGTELLFRGFDFTDGYELWKYDGSVASQIADIRPGGLNSLPTNLTAVGSNLYFGANDGVTGVELWEYDGSAVSQVIDLNPGIDPSMPASPTEKFAVIGTDLFFVAANLTSGLEVWRYDGTSVTLGKNIGPGITTSSPTGLKAIGSVLYFAADNGSTGSELWAWNPYADLSADISVVTCAAYTSPAGDLYNTEGTYNFTDTITSVLCPGCDSLVTVDLTITTQPSSSQTITACGTYTSPAGTIYNTEGTYLFTDVIPSVSCPGVDSTITIDLTLIDNISTAVVVFSGVLVAQQGGANYQWLDCNNGFVPVPGATDQDFLPTVDGNYSVVISVGGCIDTSSCYVIFGLGMQDEQELQLLLYPNPVKDVLTLQQQNAAILEIRILDAVGKQIARHQMSDAVFQIDLSGFESGMYFIEVMDDQRQSTYKFLKQ